MKILALTALALVLQQNCDGIPQGDVEYKDCEVSDQKEGHSCKAVYVGGKLLRKVYTEIKNPSPSPTIQPSTSPSSDPGPEPVPSPIVEPSTPTSPNPNDDKWCIVGPDGFFPTPPEDFCPQCWRDNPKLIAYWGIAGQSRRPCSGANCGCGIVQNVHITPHSTDDRLLRHRYDFEKKRFSGSETHKGCQPDLLSQDVPDIWVYPPNDVPGKCDPFSGSRYQCHHKAKAGTCGATKFEVRDGQNRSVTINIP